MIVANVNCPNDHVESRIFMEGVYDKIYEVMDRHDDAFVVLAGDFNACMSPGDSMNRVGSVNESIFTDYVKSNNSTCEIMDAYSSMEPNNVYKWTRQTFFMSGDLTGLCLYILSRVMGTLKQTQSLQG